MKKLIATVVSVIILLIATIFVIRHIRTNRQERTQAEQLKQMADSAATYRSKVISDSINLVIAKAKLKDYENQFDTLASDMVHDSFAMDIRRSVIRARIRNDIRSQEIRDSIGRLSLGSGNH